MDKELEEIRFHCSSLGAEPEWFERALNGCLDSTADLVTYDAIIRKYPNFEQLVVQHQRDETEEILGVTYHDKVMALAKARRRARKSSDLLENALEYEQADRDAEAKLRFMKQQVERVIELLAWAQK